MGICINLCFCELQPGKDQIKGNVRSLNRFGRFISPGLLLNIIGDYNENCISYYLPREVVFDTLREISANSEQGSLVVFDYLHSDAFIPDKVSKRVQQMQWMAAQLGEPMRAGFDPLTLSAELKKIGLSLEENLTPAAIESRYFHSRSDRYHAVEHFHYAKAAVV